MSAAADRPHLLAQRAVVRMLFDPRFAEAARHDPEGVLGALDPKLRAQLVAVDPRAFQLDRLRRRRALRTLSEEFKGTTTLVLAETRSLAFLEQFFASTPFHRAVGPCAERRVGCDDQRGSMPLAFAEFLAEAIADGRLATKLLADVLAIEATLARSRRAAPSAHPPSGRAGELALAPGVLPIEVATGALSALQQAEAYLFEVGLMPAVALCDDAPALELDARAADSTRLRLVTVPTASGVSLVTIDEELHRVLRSFAGDGARTPAALVAEAGARGVPEARVHEILRGLVEDEIVWVHP